MSSATQSEDAGFPDYRVNGVHVCHARMCLNPAHPEIPFCRDHFDVLLTAHSGFLWKSRRQDGQCGACQQMIQPDDVHRRQKRGWFRAYFDALAVFEVMERGECRALKHVDDDGFCWVCGLHDHDVRYQRANRLVRQRLSEPTGIRRKKKRSR